MKTLSYVCIKSLFLLVLLSVFVIASAASWTTNKKGVVLEGHDVVVYQIQDKAVSGSSKYSAQDDGMTFHFSNQENAK